MGNKGVLFFSYFGFPTMFPPALLQVEEAHVSPRLAALIASVGQPCSKADAQALAAAAGFESQGRPHKQAGAQQRLPLEPLMSHCLPAPHCALCSAAHCGRNSRVARSLLPLLLSLTGWTTAPLADLQAWQVERLVQCRVRDLDLYRTALTHKSALPPELRLAKVCGQMGGWVVGWDRSGWGPGGP
jgi:hypothetical protein